MARPAPGRGMRGPMGQMNPEEMRRMMQERMMERVKRNLNATDDEWAKIEPPLKKVMDLSQQAGSMGMGFRGRNMRQGPRPSGPEGMEESSMPEPETKIEKTQMDLRKALDSEDKEAIQKKLEAYREARKEAQKELAAAQKELKKQLTLQQEAELVLMGYLE